MRKKLLAMLLVLMMLVSIMPLAVSAEEECTEHDYVYEDEYTHKCTVCGNQRTHKDTDDDCICDVCGGEYHTASTVRCSDESGHWWTCENCGAVMEYKEHSDNYIHHYTYSIDEYGYLPQGNVESGSDGICDYCFYGCEHTETSTASCDDAGHYIEFCVSCGTIISDHSSCIDENEDCVCDICNGECHSIYYTLGYDETEHWHICADCGKEILREAHYDDTTETWEPYDDPEYDWAYIQNITSGSDGVCDDCYYGCQHTNTIHDIFSYEGHCYCSYYCKTCFEFLGDASVDSDGDGICDNCGGIIESTGTVTTNTSGTVSSSVTVDTSALLTEDDKLLVDEGYNVKIVLSVDEITSGVSSTDSALILSAAGDNVTAVSYLDIDLTKMTYDTNGDIYDQEALTNLNTTVTITVAIPQTLLDAVGTSTGTYSVVRVHDGIATVLATSYDSTAQTVTFATDRFSTYGIVFTGSTNTNNTNTGLDDVPQTGDGSLILVGIALMMAALPAVKKFVF